MRAEVLRPVAQAECNRLFYTRRLPDGLSPVKLSLERRMEIAGAREFLRENCRQPQAAPHWYSFYKLRREVARWINTKYFPGDDEIPRAGISEVALIVAARFGGYEITRGVLQAVDFETCISLNFTPEYERLRRERLRISANLHSHVFGD